MTKKPSRPELMMRFFPELGETITKADTKAAIEINTRACEAILADQIKLFDEFFQSRGPGVLTLRLAGGDRHSSYVVLDDWCADLVTAERLGDVQQGAFLRGIIRSIQTTDFGERALVLLVDNTSARLLPIPREYPARAIQALQEEFTS
jgi:hypothetical protein